MLKTNDRLGDTMTTVSCAILIICLVLALHPPDVSAQTGRPPFLSAQRLEMDDGELVQPIGITFSSKAGMFYVLDQTGDISYLSPFGYVVDSMELDPIVVDPVNVAYDKRSARLVIFDAAHQEFIVIAENGAGELDESTLGRHNVSDLGLGTIQGMAFTADQDALIMLDPDGRRLIRIAYDDAADIGLGKQSNIELGDARLEQLRGLAVDPVTQHLFTVSQSSQELFELTPDGSVVAIYDYDDLTVDSTHGLVFAPSRDATDDEGNINLFLVGGLGERELSVGEEDGDTSTVLEPLGSIKAYLPQVVRGTSTEGKSSGKQVMPLTGFVAELTFSDQDPDETIEKLVRAASFTSVVIQTIDTSVYSPPSPDPSGIAYLPFSGRLLIADGEVNEMPIFTGDNLFEATLNGVLVDTLTTISYSDEPSGADVNPDNRHLFTTDDTGARSIYELNPGPDGLYDTADDTVTSFRTGDFNSGDPEGVAYAKDGTGVLYLVDGVNREIYRINPGANGQFDGIGSGSDDSVTHFDTLGFGLDDPEGIAFHPTTGNLFAVGRPAGKLFEISTAGDLIQTIDISAAGARKPAGLTIAPSSLNNGHLSIFIVARGVDNNSDPNENDGMLYEMSLPQPATSPPQAVDDAFVTSVDTAVTFDVLANDSDVDGNLDPATTNNSCANGSIGCTSPAHGQLANLLNGSFVYTPTQGFIGDDSFVYEVCDTGSLCDTATVNLTVTIPNSPPLAVDDEVTINEDSPIQIDVASNDSDSDNNLDVASISISCQGCNAPSAGTATSQGDGTFFYTPTLNYDGQDSFVYAICDTLSLCDTATASITINPVADAPMALDDNAQTVADTATTINVAVNDIDVDDNLDVGTANVDCMHGSSGCISPSHGVLTNQGNGIFHYAPAQGYVGNDSFVYEICDTDLLCDTASVEILVTPPTPDVIEIRIELGSDDAEEKPTGGMRVTNSDLELVTDKSNVQTVGLRFVGMNLPAGAVVTDAYVQFQADEVNTEVTALTIRGQAADAALPFTTINSNISDRPVTNASVGWAPEPWSARGQADMAQRTPNLASVINEVVARPNWVSGNAVVLIITGSGVRTAESYEGLAAGAPLLHVEYFGGSTDNPPQAVDDNATTQVDLGVEINVAANDIDVDDNLDVGTTNVGCVHGSSGCVAPSHGVLTNQGNGIFQYAPAQGYVGNDSFVYEICDTDLLCDTASVEIEVALPGPDVIEIRIGSGSDDAEEKPTGGMRVTNSDLELVTDKSNVQTVGLRFVGMNLPAGAVVTDAYVQFQADEVNTEATALTIRGQAADAALPFANINSNISQRPVTNASVNWVPEIWPARGQADIAQRTPNLASVINEVVSRPNWLSGNPVVLIITGSGVRTAESYEGLAAAAPLLHVEYDVP